jgi:DMSO/TMAO reductase YedYZ molybdopterin-dependent catalytic subunit
MNAVNPVVPSRSTTPRRLRVAMVLLLGLTSLAQSSRAQQAGPAGEAAAARLKVAGEVAHPLDWTAADLAKLPRVTVTAKAHDGKDATYEGVAISAILEKAGLPAGKELRGKAVALYLVVEASDGYCAVFALPELDPAFTERTIILADRRDGRPLGPREGPLQVIVPGEKRHSRWVRQVVALRIGRA